MKLCVGWRRVVLLVAFAFDLAASAGWLSTARAASDYTAAQATQGARVYDRFCATCHGSDLEGKAGPPLAGKSFQETLQYAKMTTSQLYAFISQSMPQNAPGSLSSE
ncbi:MAG: c-type cytochrome [Xanthobacteraceae bacterium]